MAGRFILDPNLAARWQAMFPIPEGNEPHSLPETPVSEVIQPVVVLNPSQLIPYVLSNRQNWGLGASITLYTIPTGFHLIITYMNFFYGAAAGPGNVVLSDSTVQTWNMANVPKTPNSLDIPGLNIAINNSVVIYSSAAGELNYNINGYLERISNI